MTAAERQRRRRERLRAEQPPKPPKPTAKELAAENDKLRKQVERLKRKLADKRSRS
jgi:hypothetical protein